MMHVSRFPAIPLDHRDAAPALTAADYVALRRRAAGFTVEGLARALVTIGVHGREHRPTAAQLVALRRRAADHVRLIEQPGSVVHSRDALRLLQSVMPFDPAVYRQLADEPAERHARVCRGCGCSDHDACIAEVDGAERVCRWLSANLCTHCVDRGLAELGEAA